MAKNFKSSSNAGVLYMGLRETALYVFRVGLVIKKSLRKGLSMFDLFQSNFLTFCFVFHSFTNKDIDK